MSIQLNVNELIEGAEQLLKHQKIDYHIDLSTFEQDKLFKHGLKKGAKEIPDLFKHLSSFNTFYEVQDISLYLYLFIPLESSRIRRLRVESREEILKTILSTVKEIASNLWGAELLTEEDVYEEEYLIKRLPYLVKHGKEPIVITKKDLEFVKESILEIIEECLKHMLFLEVNPYFEDILSATPQDKRITDYDTYLCTKLWLKYLSRFRLSRLRFIVSLNLINALNTDVFDKLYGEEAIALCLDNPLKFILVRDSYDDIETTLDYYSEDFITFYKHREKISRVINQKDYIESIKTIVDCILEMAKFIQSHENGMDDVNQHRNISKDNLYANVNELFLLLPELIKELKNR